VCVSALFSVWSIGLLAFGKRPLAAQQVPATSTLSAALRNHVGSRITVYGGNGGILLGVYADYLELSQEGGTRNYVPLSAIVTVFLVPGDKDKVVMTLVASAQ
jgi:hypothetical protein